MALPAGATKKCKGCLRERAAVLFPKPTNLSSICQACTDAAWIVHDAERRRSLRLLRQDVSAHSKRIAECTPIRLMREASRMIIAARHRAASLGVPFDLTPSWALARLADGRCEATGLAMERAERGRSPFTPSIDRKDPSGGYVQANCRVVVWIYNCAKSDGVDEDVLRMARALCDKDARRARLAQDN